MLRMSFAKWFSTLLNKLHSSPVSVPQQRSARHRVFRKVSHQSVVERLETRELLSAISLSSPALDFGSDPVGVINSSPRTTTLLNQDPNNVLLGVMPGGANAADFTLVSSPNVGQLLSTTPQSFRFTFIPTIVGPESAAVTLDTSDGPLTVQLTGTGSSPIALGSPNLDFGAVQVGTMGPSIRSTSILNQDPNNILLGVTATGGNAADFTLVSGPIVGQVLPTTPVSVRFTFSPTTVGPEFATFTLNTSDGPMTVQLTGTGSSPIALASPNLDFGSVQVGTTGPSIRSTSILNQDPNNVLLGVTPSGVNPADFTIVSGPIVGQPLPTTPVSIRFTFTPTIVGPEAATFTLNTSDGPLIVQMTGNGINSGQPAPITLNHSSVSFGNISKGASALPLSLGLFNLDPNAVLLGVSSNSPLAADFPLLGPNPLPLNQPIPLSTGPTIASLSFQFGFIPSTVGSESATYTIQTSDGNLTVTLTGTGSSPIALASPNLDFGLVQVGTTGPSSRSTAILNQDPNNALLGITPGGANAADFTIVSGPSVGQILSPSQSIRFTLTPTVVGPESATFTLSTSDGPLIIHLTGHGFSSGQTAPISLNHSSVFFGNISTGTSAVPLSVALFNLDPNAALLGVTSNSPLAADFPLLSPNPLPLNQPIPLSSGPTFASLSFLFGFVPSTVGTESATYTIQTSDGNLTVTLSGTYGNPAVLASPNLDFGSVQVGTTGPSVRSTSILNQDPNNVLLGVTPSGANAADFTIVSGPIVGQPLPSTPVSIRFTFTPTIVGPESATFTLNTSDGPLVIQLTGFGISSGQAAPITLNHSSVSFGNVSKGSSALPLTVGLFNLDPNAVLLGVTSNSPLAADFPLLSPNPLPLNQPIPLSPNPTISSLNFQFGFIPSTVGSESATYTIQTSDGNLTVTLSGNGTSPISLSHSSVSFGNIPTGDSAVPLSVGLFNLDPNAVLLGVTSNSPLAADFPLLNPNPLPLNQPIPLSPNPTIASLSFQFGFIPSTVGTESVTYTIQTSDGNLTVTLSGTGTSPINLSRSSLDFTTNPVGTSAAPLTVGLWSFGSNVQFLGLTTNSPLAADFPLLQPNPLPVDQVLSQAQAVTSSSSGVASMVFEFGFVPSQTGIEVVTYNVETTAGNLSLTLTGNSAVTLTTNSLANADVGTAYSQTITSIGGNGGNNFSVTGGTLPGWLHLNSSTGVLSGTPGTNDVGTVYVTIGVADNLGSTDSKSLNFTVNAADVLTTTSLPNADVGVSYSQTITSIGGNGGNSFNVTGGTLPAWLTLNSSTGVLSGTPGTNDVGTVNVTISVADNLGSTDSKSLNFTVNAADSLTTTSLSNADVGIAYSQAITSTGGNGGNSFDVTGGILPGWLHLNSSTGLLSGTPGTNDIGTVNVTIGVADDLGSADSKSLIFTVNAADSLTTTSLPNADVGIAYSQAITSTGGNGGNSFNVTGGTLPGWLHLNSSIGVLSGTPGTNDVGTVYVTIGVADNLGSTDSKSLNFTVNAADALTTTSLPNADVGIAYSQTITSIGGNGGNSFNVTGGTLPGWLHLNSSTGVLSGTPGTNDVGTVNVTIGVTDSLGSTDSKSFNFTVNAADSLTTTSLPNADVGIAYSQTISSTGGNGGNSFSVTGGTLPSWLHLNSSTGVLSGTPGTNDVGTVNVTIGVADNLGSTDSKPLNFTVNAADSLTTTSLPNADVGISYSQTITSIGGNGGNSFSVTGGTLPGWLHLNSSTGVLSGTPGTNDVGTVNVTIGVTDNLGGTDSKSFNFTVNPVTSLGTLSYAQWTINKTNYSGAIPITGGNGTYNSLSVNGLPTGLSASLAGSTVLITGTPTAVAGSYSFTVSVQDGLGSMVNRNFAFTVDPSTTMAWTGRGSDDLWNDANNWSGAVPVSGDTLIFASGALQQSMSYNNFAANTTFASIVFQDSGYIITGNAIKLSGGITAIDSVTGLDTIGLNIGLTANQTFDVRSPSGVVQLSGVLSGTSSITKTGAGTLDLTGSASNTFSGTTTVSSGQLQLDKSSGNAVAALVVSPGASVVYLGHDNQISDTAQVTVNGSLNLAGRSDTIGALSLTGGSITTGSGTLTLGGNATSNGTSNISGNLNLGGAVRTVTVASGTLTISAIVSNGDLTKAGTGILILSGANSFSAGTTTVSAGILNLQNNLALGNTTTVSVSTGAQIQLQGGITIGDNVTLRGSGVGATGVLDSVDGNNTWAGAVNLTANSTFGVDAGQLTIGGVISGNFGLTKVGAGTLVLTGANTYSGGTTINAGTLLAENLIANSTGTGIVKVNNSGTLGGNGKIGAVQVNSGGTLMPGSSGTTAILNGSSLKLGSGSLFAVNVNGPGAGTDYSQFHATGTVNLGSASLNVTIGGNSHIGDSYAIIKSANPVIGTFAGLAEGARFAVGSVVLQITYHGGSGNDVVLTRIS